ncbi:hypothetical protein Pmani_027852 [Petrolisthes manimaculis]|uniref:Uncharacterized protein n=1 Tax=Petrolisthes manimaculis TaxID=1843537 RepID=A0AAE1TVD3_9EUCA|nr:hypothetical protein Pmani_027852 [Petrolisthes manimaculis]
MQSDGMTDDELSVLDSGCRIVVVGVLLLLGMIFMLVGIGGIRFVTTGSSVVLEHCGDRGGDYWDGPWTLLLAMEEEEEEDSGRTRFLLLLAGG